MPEEKDTLKNQAPQPVAYTDDNIRHLSDMEHVRTRPGMYIGRLGDGSLPEDGIYVLLKEVIDNSIDEFKMNAGDRIEVDLENNLTVRVRDYGRGIPQGKLVEAVSKLNTGGKYDTRAFKKSVGLNGVGVKAVNALSSRFEVRSYREGQVRKLVFEKAFSRAMLRKRLRMRMVRISSFVRTTACSRTILSMTRSWRRCSPIIPI